MNTNLDYGTLGSMSNDQQKAAINLAEYLMTKLLSQKDGNSDMPIITAYDLYRIHLLLDPINEKLGESPKADKFLKIWKGQIG